MNRLGAALLHSALAHIEEEELGLVLEGGTRERLEEGH